MERPKKDNPPNDDDIGPPEVLTDVFHCPPDVDKFTHDYNTTDYGMPGKRLNHMLTSKIHVKKQFKLTIRFNFIRRLSNAIEI